MRKPLLLVVGVAAVIIAVIVLLKVASAPAAGRAYETAWGDPDLQGLWENEYQTPMQRPARYADQEFFTEEQIAELDQKRAARITPQHRVAPRGTLEDLSGAYSTAFQAKQKPTGRRTSLIVDPPNGRLPSLAPEVQKRRRDLEEYRVALLQAVPDCKKSQHRECARVKYTGVPSPRRAEMPPHYLSDPGFQSLNRIDGPEDFAHGERCLSGGLPVLGGVQRIVQSPGSVSIAYQGWHRTIPVTTSPHLPSHVRQWRGDSRGRWEGNTLVVDVTNFSPKADFQGSRENLHLIERFTRIDEKTLEYAVTVEDPTTWTQPWTAKVELTRQDERANQIYDEPRCPEGNYNTMVLMLAGARLDDQKFAEGRGPNPATICYVRCGFGLEEDDRASDPLR